MSKLIIQKSFLVLGIVSLLLIGCASSSDSTKAANTNAPATISSTPEVKSMPVAIVEDGWGVNPRESSNVKDVNGITDVSWYTKKYSGKAASRSIELKSPSYMESSCKQTVKKENGKSLIESAFLSLGSEIKPETIVSLVSKISKDDLQKIEVSNCKPTSAEKTFSECECSLSYKAEGGKKALMEKIIPLNK